MKGSVNGDRLSRTQHKDEALRDQPESHLALLKNQGLMEAWYDRRIVAGDEVDDAVFSKLETEGFEPRAWGLRRCEQAAKVGLRGPSGSPPTQSHAGSKNSCRIAPPLPADARRSVVASNSPGNLKGARALGSNINGHVRSSSAQAVSTCSGEATTTGLQLVKMPLMMKLHVAAS